MEIVKRIMAVAEKEHRLNFRFPIEYLAANGASPIKSAVLMYLLYRGFLKNSDIQVGLLNGDNFQLFVIVGTTCHSLFSASLATFRGKMSQEKYWQTITATLVSPATALEVVLGFVIGSAGIHLFVSTVILIAATLLFHLTLNALLVSLGILVLVCLLGFGVGLIGTTVSLVWEGKSFIFDYSSQGLIFLSCFYYPIETLPSVLHPLIRVLPTYRAAEMIQSLFLTGNIPNFFTSFSYVAVWAVAVFIIPALFMDYSVKKWGVVGY